MTTVKVRGALTIGGATVRCPGAGTASVPRELTLMPSGQGVNATCGERHRPGRGGRHTGPRAQCFFPVNGLTAANLAALAKGKPGRFRLTLPGGSVVEGTLAAVGEAGASSTSKAAAAVAAKGGKGAAPGPAKPAGRATGGSLAAAFNAVAAVAGAAGQTAAAVGQVATAGASAVGSVASVAREGIGAGRDGIKAADNYGKRRHERKMSAADDGDDD